LKAAIPKGFGGHSALLLALDVLLALLALDGLQKHRRDYRHRKYADEQAVAQDSELPLLFGDFVLPNFFLSEQVLLDKIRPLFTVRLEIFSS
jgi:hypothetical protein